MLTPGHDLVEVIAGRNRGAGDQEQNLGQGVGHPPGLAVVLPLRKMLQQQGQPVPRHLLLKTADADGGQSRSPRESWLPERITPHPSTQNPR